MRSQEFLSYEPLTSAQEVVLKAKTDRQEEAAATYHGNVLVTPAEKGEVLTPQEIVRRFEVDHVVREAPLFAEQALETDRTNQVTYVDGVREFMGSDAMRRMYRPHWRTMSEQDGLVELYDFLERTHNYAYRYSKPNSAEQARGISDNLTFIGEKEYAEATAGIATYWKALLDRNPDQQVLVLATEVSKRFTGGIKSDQYLFERILERFDDAELENYAGRLITDFGDVTATSPKDLRVVLLDDWTISGDQLTTVAREIQKEHARFLPSVEVQLIAASPKRIKQGFDAMPYRPQAPRESVPLPLRAYFMAHQDETSQKSETRITGAHSSVDFDFENEIKWIADDLRSAAGMRARFGFLFGGIGRYVNDLPAMTNIIRPYRKKGFTLARTETLKRINTEHWRRQEGPDRV